MNESEIRSNIIDPLLSTLNFTHQNISLEKSFKIKLGKYDEIVGWQEEKRRPRYDYLVKKDEKNLFIIEAKKEGDELNDEDLEQGLSYARLLDSIAPLVVLTNGTSTKVFDTISREELTDKQLQESDYAKNNFTVNIDYETRHMALLALFTLNHANFLSFCNKQNSDTLSRLLGSNATSNLRSYIPEIFVKRRSLDSTVDDFIDGNDSCLLITGKSGIGKTNAMCHLVEEIRKRFPVLFYNCGQISENLEKELSDDLNWEFSTSKSIEQFASQINDICNKHDQKLILFLDAIDEWKLDSASINLSKFVNHVKNKKIKLIISCKDTRLGDFLVINGSPSSLSQNLYVHNQNEVRTNFFNLSEFSFNELVEVIRKYSQHFSLSGFNTTSDTFHACKDPIILRVVSEVYSGKSVPSSLSSRQIYEKYLEMLYGKKPRSDLSIRKTLTGIAKQMITENSEEIDENSLTEVDPDTFSFLADYGIISNRQNNKGQHVVNFSFDGLRNYFLTHHVLELNSVTNVGEFEDIVSSKIRSKLGRELFRWYKEIASDAQKTVLQDQIEASDKELAKEYLDKFIIKTKTDFPFIKKYLYPNNNLGLLVLYNKERNFTIEFGFREYSEGEERIVWKDTTNSIIHDGKSLSSLMRRYNVPSLTFFSSNFSNSPIEDFVESQIFRMTKEILKHRGLDERNNVGISLEKLFVALRSLGGPLGLPDTYDTEEDILPLNIRPYE